MRLCFAVALGLVVPVVTGFPLNWHGFFLDALSTGRGCVHVCGLCVCAPRQALEQRAARQLVTHTLLSWPEDFPLPVQDPLQIPLYLKFLQSAFAEAKPRKDTDMLKQLTSTWGMPH